MTTFNVRGRVWLFPESDINTDQIMPSHTFLLPEAERKKHVLATLRPGWSAEVRAGDIIVGGGNFGVGSGRPSGRALKSLGIVAVVAESINGLFLRNCINNGLVALSCPGVAAAFADGDIAEIDPLQGAVSNATRGTALTGQKLPPNLLELVAAGGVVELLLRDGSMSPP